VAWWRGGVVAWWRGGVTLRLTARCRDKCSAFSMTVVTDSMQMT
jgi:hypothetical protein